MQEFNEMLNNYLNEHFSDVRLESPLFYQAPIGLRFELGVLDNKQYGIPISPM